MLHRFFDADSCTVLRYPRLERNACVVGVINYGDPLSSTSIRGRINKNTAYVRSSHCDKIVCWTRNNSLNTRVNQWEVGTRSCTCCNTKIHLPDILPSAMQRAKHVLSVTRLGSHGMLRYAHTFMPSLFRSVDSSAAQNQFTYHEYCLNCELEKAREEKWLGIVLRGMAWCACLISIHLSA